MGMKLTSFWGKNIRCVGWSQVTRHLATHQFRTIWPPRTSHSYENLGEVLFCNLCVRWRFPFKIVTTPKSFGCSKLFHLPKSYPKKRWWPTSRLLHLFSEKKWFTTNRFSYGRWGCEWSGRVGTPGPRLPPWCYCLDEAWDQLHSLESSLEVSGFHQIIQGKEAAKRSRKKLLEADRFRALDQFWRCLKICKCQVMSRLLRWYFFAYAHSLETCWTMFFTTCVISSRKLQRCTVFKKQRNRLKELNFKMIYRRIVPWDYTNEDKNYPPYCWLSGFLIPASRGNTPTCTPWKWPKPFWRKGRIISQAPFFQGLSGMLVSGEGITSIPQIIELHSPWCQ